MPSLFDNHYEQGAFLRRRITRIDRTELLAADIFALLQAQRTTKLCVSDIVHYANMYLLRRGVYTRVFGSDGCNFESTRRHCRNVLYSDVAPIECNTERVRQMCNGVCDEALVQLADRNGRARKSCCAQ